MKVITEALIRQEIKDSCPKMYYIPEGKILSPAAREYLNQQKIGIDFERNRKNEEEPVAEEAVSEASSPKVENNALPQAKYTDYETGASYYEKPEHMCQLFGNMLVDKNHPRILFRGKLDSTESEVVLAQSMIAMDPANVLVLRDLDDILKVLRELMRCEVLDEEFKLQTIIGFTHEELRERSHATMKFYNIEYMKLPDYTMGSTYAWLNKIRASIRETEVAAVNAFKDKRRMDRNDIVEELNRLSSALHIMMLKYLAGEYQVK